MCNNPILFFKCFFNQSMKNISRHFFVFSNTNIVKIDLFCKYLISVICTVEPLITKAREFHCVYHKIIVFLKKNPSQ